MNIFLKFVLTYVVAVLHLGGLLLGLKLFYPSVDLYIIFIGMLGVTNALGWQLGLLVERLTVTRPVLDPIPDFSPAAEKLEIHHRIDPIDLLESATVMPKTKKKMSPETIEKIRAASFAREKEKREQRERIAKTKATADKKKARKAAATSPAPTKVKRVPAKRKTVKK